MITGGKDSDAGKEVPERPERVDVPTRPQREAGAGVTTQGEPTQGS